MELPLSLAAIHLEWKATKELFDAVSASIESGPPESEQEQEAWLREVVGTMGYLSKKLDILAVTLVSPPGG